MSFQDIKDFANWATRNGSFVLTFICITGVLAGKYIGVTPDISILPTLLGLYLGQRASRAISGHWAAAKDPDCDTEQVIRELEGGSPPERPKT